jgi:hypothetical protein
LTFTGSGCGPAARTWSTFEADAEGWAVANNGATTQAALVSAGGNPGGHLCGTDESSGEIWYFVAPQKYLGNASGAFTKRLTFDLKQNKFFYQIRGRDVVLNGGGLALV